MNRLTRLCLIGLIAATIATVFCSHVFADNVFSDDFSSPDGPLIGTSADVGYTWGQTGTNATNSIQISGGAVALVTTGQDAFTAFSSSVANVAGLGITTSLDLNVVAAKAAGDYFLHLSDPVGTTSLFYQRLFARSSPGGYQIGLLDAGGTGSITTWGTQELSFGTTYHVDVTWNFMPGTADDTFSVALDGTPYLSHTWTSVNNEPIQISAVNFRQGNSSTTVPTLSVDNLVISRLPAPFNIFKWEYIDPNDPGQGKQESSELTIDGYGLHAQPGLSANFKNLSMAYLVGADLTGASFDFSNLIGANLSQANLANAYLNDANLDNADLNLADLTGAFLNSANFSGANLSGANLTNARADFNPVDFSGANLSGAKLTNAQLYSARLTGANLSGAEVRGARFEYSDITPAQLYATASYLAQDLSGISLAQINLAGANFASQNLTNAYFYSANLTGANLSQANLTNAFLGSANFSGANLSGAVLIGANVGNANFNGAGLTLAQLYSTASYPNGNLWGIGLANADLTGAEFAGKNLDYSNLSSANLSQGNLTSATLNYANLSNVDLNLANLTGASLYSANLSGANVSGAVLIGANVDYANFAGSDLTLAQLYSTANFASGYLYGVGLANTNLSGANFANKYLSSPNFSSANLSQANFTSATLPSANLSGADLNLADLTGASLSGANFSGANLSGAILTSANVENANFNGAGLTLAQLYSTASYQNGNLSGIGLANADLTGADFSNKSFVSANFSSANLSQANFTSATLYYADLTGADLNLADLTGASLGGVNFSDANLSGAVLAGATVEYANFNGAGLTPAQLYSTASYQNGNLSGIGLPNADLTSADFAGKNLDHANFSSVILSGANLTNAQLNYATLTGANLNGAEVRGARFDSSDVTPDQLYATASYLAQDLSGISLAQINLAGANFAGQNLTNAYFYSANLTGANLSQANLTNARFNYADVTGADFSGADVRGAYLGTTNFTAAQLYTTASYLAHDLSGIKLPSNNLPRTNLSGQNLSNANLNAATLTRANFSQANLTSANLSGANLTGANLTDAILADAIVTYAKLSSTHITLDQLYSTASYQNQDLTGVHFIGNDLTGANFAGQALPGADFYAAKLVGADFTNANLTMAELINADMSGANLAGANFTDGSLALANLTGANLTNANLSGTNLIGANLAGADIRGASLSKIILTSNPGGISSCKICCGFVYDPGTQNYVAGTGVTLAQLGSTASYAAHDLSVVTFLNNNFNGGNFAGFNLTNANFTGTTLVGADLSGADARGASGLGSVVASNFIRPDGHIAGVNLNAGQILSIRDYDGTSSSALIPIHVDLQMAMASDAALRLIFEADPWDSTISFASGVPVTLGGILELAFAADVSLASQIGRTFDVFDWTGVTPTGAFDVDSPYLWDLSNLYTSGEITFLAASGLTGDFNADGTVDAADYVVWRKGIGPSYSPLANNVWRAYFGLSSGSGNGSAVELLDSKVPEPTSLAMSLVTLGLFAAWTTRRARRSRILASLLRSACYRLSILGLLVLACNRSFAASPEIQLTKIGAPIWKPVDFQLFSAPATPFDQEFGLVYSTLLPNDYPLNPNYVPHAPPYDTELSAGMLAGGYVSQSVFTPDAITLHPNGVYFAYMLVPDPGITGSSRDFAAGPVIPNSLFPLAANYDVWLDGVLVDRAPGADAITPVQPRDVGHDGTSHLEALQVFWHPWDDDLTVGPLGNYELRASIRDVGGSGWDVVTPFRVVSQFEGDFNHDGTVDAADYVMWRKTNAGNSQGYTDWRENFGEGMGTGGGSAGASPSQTGVPEPATMVLLMFAAVGWCLRRERPHRKIFINSSTRETLNKPRFRNGRRPALPHVPVVVSNALHPVFQNSSTRRFLRLKYSAEKSYVFSE